MYVPREDVIELSLSVEEAAKLVISAGLVVPDENQKRLAEMANAAKRNKNAPAAEPITPKDAA